MTQRSDSDERGPTERTLRIDPHVHSVDSYDSATPVRRLLERTREIGLDGVVVTDHDAIEASIRAADLAPEYGLLGIPGAELSTADGHLLAIGVRELPTPDRPLPETVRDIRDLGGIAVVPHPFQRSKHGAKKCVIVECDGIEVYNAHAMTGVQNRRARTFALARGYSLVGSSDAHVAGTIGRAYTEVRVERGASIDTETLLTAIRAGDTRACGRRTSIRQYLRTLAASARRWGKTFDRRVETSHPNR